MIGYHVFLLGFVIKTGHLLRHFATTIELPYGYSSQPEFDMMGIKGDGEQGKATVGLNTNKRTYTLNPRDSNRYSICLGSDWVWTLLMVR